MKNQFLLLLSLVTFFSSQAQITILNGPNGQCKKYTLQYEGNLTPPYYPGWGTFPTGSGYSYFWYTSDGQTSCAAQPSFSFVNAPIQINLVLTPRKKPVGDHKERIQAQLTVDHSGNPMELADPTNCPFAPPINAEPWSDLSPKVGDTVYIVFPLERCNEPIFSGSLDFHDNELGSPFFLPFGGINITNQTPTSVDFNFTWPNTQQSAEVVVGFEVLAAHDEPVVCSLIYTNDSTCNQNLVYSDVANGGPYDPNILSPSLGIEMEECGIAGDSITYNLQFQNEGSGPTSRVCVFVRLDDNIEASSFRFVGAHANGNSLNAIIHDMSSTPNFIASQGIETSYDPTQPNVYCIELSPCVLTQKTLDYHGSIGHVTFKAKVIANLSPGQQMITQSEVVFNHNYAVQTNNAITSCLNDTSNCCTGKESCCCSNCCKPWYKHYGWWVAGILGLLLILVWFKRRN